LAEAFTQRSLRLWVIAAGVPIMATDGADGTRLSFVTRFVSEELFIMLSLGKHRNPHHTPPKTGKTTGHTRQGFSFGMCV